MTTHVRHLAKYIDMPVEESRAFVFWSDAGLTGQRAHTLGELAEVLDHGSARRFDGHLRRKDFSRSTVGVFGDHALGNDVGRIEDEYCRTSSGEAVEEIVRQIQAHYDINHPAAA